MANDSLNYGYMDLASNIRKRQKDKYIHYLTSHNTGNVKTNLYLQTNVLLCIYLYIYCKGIWPQIIKQFF
jgi:hypothetical protein